jgi:hypothetical protein
LVVGLGIYWFYGRSHSKLEATAEETAAATVG